MWELTNHQRAMLTSHVHSLCWMMGMAGSVARDIPANINRLKPGPSSGFPGCAGFASPLELAVFVCIPSSASQSCP